MTHEVHSPARQRRCEQQQHVDRGERAEERLDREHHQPPARDERGPRQAHPVGREDLRHVQGVDVVGQCPVDPPDRPLEELRVGPARPNVTHPQLRDDGPRPDHDRRDEVEQERDEATGPTGKPSSPRPQPVEEVVPGLIDHDGRIRPRVVRGDLGRDRHRRQRLPIGFTARGLSSHALSSLPGSRHAPILHACPRPNSHVPTPPRGLVVVPSACLQRSWSPS